MSDEPRYSRLRLVIPSIAQGNALGKKGGSDWCGRTSSAMIHNYFTATRGGGIAATKSKLIVNQRDRAPYDLVFADTKAVAVAGYELAGTIRKAKPSYVYYAARDGAEHPPLWPMAARKGVPTAAEQLVILAPVLRALEAFNPVLFYSGLSSNAGQSRHIVVISGYRWQNGELWLHIDDPSSRYTEKEGKPQDWFLCGALTEKAGSLATQLVQLPADSGTDEPARRYLLRASRLFEPNLHSTRTDDCWCDHSDSPGFTVVLSHVVEASRELVEADSSDPGLPLELAQSSVSRIAGLTAAREQARKAGAPFPLGTHRWWHDGIHLFAEGDATAVRPLACGELVTARLPPQGADGRDRGAMVFRHSFDPARGTVVATGERVPAGAITFFTMLVHLAGGARGHAQLRARLEPGKRPEPTVMPGTSLVLVAHDEQSTAHGLGEGFGATRQHPRSEGVAIDVADGAGAGELFSLGNDDTDAGAWSARPPAPPVAPAGARHALRDAGTDELFVLDGIPRARIELAVAPDTWELVVRAQQDDRRWCPWQREAPVRIEGSTMMCSHGKAEREALGKHAAAVVRGPGTVLVQLPSGATGTPMLVDWPNEPAVIQCDEQGVLAIELHARIEKRHAPIIAQALAAGRAPKVFASLDLVAGERRFPVRAQRWVELDHAGGALVFDPTSKGTRARVGTVAIRLRERSRYCCVHTTSDGAALAAMTEDAPVISLRTDAKLRARIGTEGRACTLAVTELRAYGDPKAPYDARVRLEPCVGLDDAQWETVANAHAQRRSAAHGDVHARLVARQSRLAAVRVDPKGSWQRTGAAVHPRDGAQHDLWLDLVAGKHGWRVVPASRQALDTLPATLRLPVLASFTSGGASYAVIELRLAARKADFTDALVQRWQTRVDLRDRVLAAVGEETWTDFAAIERELATDDDPPATLSAWRTLARDPIAEAGFVEPGARGLHVQLFSVDPLFPDDDAHGHWPECGADVTGAPLSRELFEGAVRSVLAPKTARDAATPLPKVAAVLRALERGGVTPAAWRELCSDAEVDRQLARLVAVHDSEWSIDWAKAAREAGRSGGDGLEPADAAWPSDAAALGLPTGKLRFHHPLRALEWLGTGVELTVASKQVDTCRIILPGGAELELPPTKQRDGYTAGGRLLLGELLQGPMPAKLHVPGHTKGNETLPIALARGEVLRLWICTPDVTIAPTAVDRAQPFALAVRRGEPEPSPGETHLLADRNARLERAWESRASVTITATWNLCPPEKLSITLEGADFAFDGVPRASSDRAELVRTASGYDVTIAFDPNETFTGPRSLQLEVSVCTADALDVSGKLKVAASGGDLAKAVQLEHRLATRTIAMATPPVRGRDVAKVQLYLSQICALGQPCLLPSGRDQSASIDGGYDRQVALALWTFVLGFANAGQWQADRLQCQGGELSLSEPLWSRPPGASDAEAWPLLCNAADAALQEYGAITIDRPLVDELVRHYAMPLVLPLVELSVAPPSMSTPLAAQLGKLDAAASARLVPVPGLDPANVVRLAVKLQPGFDRAGADRTWVDIDEGGGDYQLDGNRTRRTLEELLRDGLVLVPSGTIGAAKERNRIALAIAGHELGAIALSGTRSLHALDKGRGLDVLLVQGWLGRQCDAEGHPLLPKSDGTWGGQSAAALNRFVALRGVSSDYAEEMRDLAAGTALPAATPAEVHAP